MEDPKPPLIYTLQVTAAQNTSLSNTIDQKKQPCITTKLGQWLCPGPGEDLRKSERELLSSIHHYSSIPSSEFVPSSPQVLHIYSGLVEVKEGEAINTAVMMMEKEETAPTATAADPNHPLEAPSVASDVRQLPPPNKDTVHLVICHGFGAGLGFFYRNYYDLCQIPDCRIYAVDWLGMGLSSRPPFPKRSNNDNLEEVESFFVHSLEAWREKMGLTSFSLLGHSLGGYLCGVYSLHYPERVRKLFLVSPAAMAETPDYVKDLIQQDYRARIVSHLWEQNVTPQSLVRWAGPFGHNLVSKYTARRLGHLPEVDLKLMTSYIYTICAQPGSGEYAMNGIMAPLAFARTSLSDRLRNSKTPIIFLYGENDWMDPKLANKLKESRKESSVKIIIISNAGHHLYLDNYVEFNKHVVQEMLTEYC